MVLLLTVDNINSNDSYFVSDLEISMVLLLTADNINSNDNYFVSDLEHGQHDLHPDVGSTPG